MESEDLGECFGSGNHFQGDPRQVTLRLRALVSSPVTIQEGETNRVLLYLRHLAVQFHIEAIKK